MEKLLKKLEDKFGNYALKGLINYVAGLMIIVFLLTRTNTLHYSLINLNGAEILRGQIWRIFTFALIPSSSTPLMLIFEIMILVMCANGIESAWGTFKFSVYYVSGLIFLSLASLFIPVPIPGSYFIYLNLFLAFSSLYPDYTILFMFIIPIKVKYLAYFYACYLIYMAVRIPILALPLIIAFGNYIIFFGSTVLENMKKAKARKAYDAKFEPKSSQESTYRHKCTVCGRTEVSNPELQFRYCTCKQCGDKGVCFCLEHLKQHKEQNK